MAIIYMDIFFYVFYFYLFLLVHYGMDIRDGGVRCAMRCFRVYVDP